MAIGGTPIPKREINALILRNISIEQIRSMLKIQTETDLHRRLDDFSKNQLLEVIQSTEEGRLALEEAKTNYSLTSNPTLYIISVSFWPERQALIERTRVLANKMHEDAVRFGNDRSVRSIYMIAAVREYQGQIVFQEVPLVY